MWENCHPCCSSFRSLSLEMRRVFDRALVGREAARMLADLRQGERSVSDYSIQFRTLAAECEWNEKAQWDMFLHGLADRIQQEIYTVELPTGLDELVDLALRVDAWMRGFSNAICVVDASLHQNILPSTLAIWSVTRRLTNPCRWVELGSPGRREIVGG